jgi:UDP-glucose 4-epimerase
LLADVDTVIHLAGLERKLRAGPRLYDAVNHQATARLATAAAQAGIRHFILASSLSAQHGSAADHALTERDPAMPADDQGRSKLAAENALRASGAPFTILRLAPVYGPGMSGGLAFLLRAAVSPVPLPVRDFTNRRSYLGLDNFLSALKFFVARSGASNDVYLVADPGIPPNMADLIRAIRHAAGRRALLLPSQVRYAEMPLRMVRLGGLWDRYCGNLRVDCGKLIAAGWEPVYDTRTGIGKLTQNSGAALYRATPPAA